MQNDFKLSLMAPDDLREYAGLTTTVVTCRQKIPMIVAGPGLVRWSLENMFGAVVDVEDDEDEDDAGDVGDSDDDDYDVEHMLTDGEDEKKEEKKAVTGKTFRIMDTVTVRCKKGYVEMEWVGNVLNDGVADATASVLMELETSPAAVRRMYPSSPPLVYVIAYTSTIIIDSAQPHYHHDHQELTPLSQIPEKSPHSHTSHSSQRLERILLFLETQFGDCVTPLPPTATSPQQLLTQEDAPEDQIMDQVSRVVPGVQIKIDSVVANVYFDSLTVESRNESLKMRVKTVVERAIETSAGFVA